jgi:tetratricopeptide (TPR) repeat protein
MLKKRSRGIKKTRRNKKRNGGASRASGASASPPKPKTPPKSRTERLRMLLGGPGGPKSGLVGVLSKKLLSGMDMRPRQLESLRHHSIIGPASMKLVEDETFKMAEQMHATSFRYRTRSDIAKGELQRCIDANVEAVKQLREAIDMGSLRARACLADMLLNGYTAGVSKNVREAKRLVSEVDDPDCKGVLAHCHFNDGIKAGPALAAQSAAAGSKYGQYVVGLYEMQKGKTKEASDYFTLAVEQNYDEAQIALGKIKMQSDPDEALRLLNLAADQGNADAFYSIAEIYRRKSNDNPYALAFMDAMAWCQLAVTANHPYAFDTLSGMQNRLQRS